MPGISLPGGAGQTDLPETESPREVGGGADAAAELPGGLSIEQASARVTKHNKGNWDYAWIVELRNDNKRRLRLNLTVRFLDADGYVLAETTHRGVAVPARGRRTAKGVHKLDAVPAGKVASINVAAIRAR